MVIPRISNFNSRDIPRNSNSRDVPRNSIFNSRDVPRRILGMALQFSRDEYQYLHITFKNKQSIDFRILFTYFFGKEFYDLLALVSHRSYAIN